ncbi:MAG: substrate-binding domain-containing protein [Candidatus Contubernalis sp.]|nr:substrate-binding domain-containing protein [Candidatus Contubernalis sp.]
MLLVTVLGTVVGCEQTALAPTENEFILLATTTSTYDSGLLDDMLPAFEEKYGIEVRVLPKGTGQALELGRGGDVDVLLVHDRSSELKMVEEGFFVDRSDVMYNDFIIVGPASDPAGIKGINEAKEALKAIARGNHIFVSRGDNSGTHSMEVSLWEAAGISDCGRGYKSVGQGMGDTLRMADEQEGYTLTDRATYIALKEALEMDILLEGDSALFNQYGIMAVNPDKHSHIKYESALKLIDFFMSEEGQKMIADYKLQEEVLFFPGMGLEE